MTLALVVVPVSDADRAHAELAARGVEVSRLWLRCCPPKPCAGAGRWSTSSTPTTLTPTRMWRR